MAALTALSLAEVGLVLDGRYEIHYSKRPILYSCDPILTMVDVNPFISC
jgi:hypothetical protein